MRDLKFRAWFKKEQKMVYNDFEFTMRLISGSQEAGPTEDLKRCGGQD